MVEIQNINARNADYVKLGTRYWVQGAGSSLSFQLSVTFAPIPSLSLVSYCSDKTGLGHWYLAFWFGIDQPSSHYNESFKNPFNLQGLCKYWLIVCDGVLSTWLQMSMVYRHQCKYQAASVQMCFVNTEDLN